MSERLRELGQRLGIEGSKSGDLSNASTRIRNEFVKSGGSQGRLKLHAEGGLLEQINERLRHTSPQELQKFVDAQLISPEVVAGIQANRQAQAGRTTGTSSPEQIAVRQKASNKRPVGGKPLEESKSVGNVASDFFTRFENQVRRPAQRALTSQVGPLGILPQQQALEQGDFPVSGIAKLVGVANNLLPVKLPFSERDAERGVSDISKRIKAFLSSGGTEEQAVIRALQSSGVGTLGVSPEAVLAQPAKYRGLVGSVLQDPETGIYVWQDEAGKFRTSRTKPKLG